MILHGEREYAEAVSLAKEGFAIFPVHTSRKFDGELYCSCGKRGCTGKEPLVRFSEEATRDIKTIDRWFQPIREPAYGIGIHLGKSYAWVVDIDGPEGIAEWDSILKENGGSQITNTRTVKTGGGGRHYYFAGWIDRINSGILSPNIHIKGNLGNAYVVAPPSLHHSGKRYEYITRIPPADAPDWLIELVKKKTISLSRGSAVSKEQIESRRSYEIPILNILKEREKNLLRTEGKRIVGCHPVHLSTTGKNFCIDTSLNRWYCFRCQSSGGPIELAAVLAGLCKCDEFNRSNLIRPLSGRKFVLAIQACLDRGVNAEALKIHISKGAYHGC